LETTIATGFLSKISRKALSGARERSVGCIGLRRELLIAAGLGLAVALYLSLIISYRAICYSTVVSASSPNLFLQFFRITAGGLLELHHNSLDAIRNYFQVSESGRFTIFSRSGG
jgi:hypothetical protein